MDVHETQAKSSAHGPGRLLIGVLLSFFRAMTGAYALSVLGALALRWLIGEQWALVAFSNSVLHLLMLPALVLLPITLLLRRWELVLMLLPITLMWGVWYADQLLPGDTHRQPPDARTISVLTYNINWNNRSHDAVRTLLLATDADVIALQELTADMGRRLNQELEDRYPHRALAADDVRGMGVFSRFPITEAEAFRGVFTHQRMQLDLDGRPVVLYNVHAVSPISGVGFDGRARDLEAIYTRLAQETNGYPRLLVGDFNLTPLTEDYARLTADHNDSYAAVGDGLGYTLSLCDWLPLARIDYVFYTPSYFQPVEAVVWPAKAGSDHAPLLAEIALKPE